MNDVQVPQSVVVVLSRIPQEPFDGAMVTVHNTLVELRKAGCHITLLALNPVKHRVSREQAQQYADDLTLIDIDTTITMQGALRALFRRYEPVVTDLPTASYQIQRFFSATMFRALLERCRQPVDLIHFDGLPMAWYGVALQQVLSEACPPWIYRAHNAEYRILEQQARNTVRPAWQRWYYRLLAAQTRRFEQAIIGRAPVVATVSDTDTQVLSQLVSALSESSESSESAATIRTVRPGFDVAPHLHRASLPEPRTHLGFLGSLEWEPNIEGLEWFVHHVWPRIRRTIPEARLTIAGRAPGERVYALQSAEGVEVKGPVESASEFLQSVDVVIAPVLSGSGIRMKLLEGMANGCAIVTTSSGAEGLPLMSGYQLLIADDPAAYAQSCVMLIQDPHRARTIGEHGRQLISEQFSWDSSMRALLATYSAANAFKRSISSRR